MLAEAYDGDDGDDAVDADGADDGNDGDISAWHHWHGLMSSCTLHINRWVSQIKLFLNMTCDP